MFRARWFFLYLVASFFTINLVTALVLNLTVPNVFENSVLQSMISGLSFLFAFIMLARHYVPSAPSRFWIKLVIIALASFVFYAVLCLAFGEPLLRAMGFEVTPVPPSSPLSPSEYGILAFYTYGISSITNGLVAVAVAYYLQKYMVRGLFFVFKRINKYKHFIEAGGATKVKSRFIVHVLWLMLLPFPIQNVLTPNTVGVSVLGTSLYLLSALALFALWGLGVAAIVGVSKRSIFRPYSAFREALLWFLALQWLSSLIYSFFNPPLFADSLFATVLLLIRVLFAFGPPALITAYLYKGVLEERAETRIVEHLRQKDNLETVEIMVRVEESKSSENS